MSKWYILDDDNNPVKSTVNEFVDWEEAYPEKRIIKQYDNDEVFVSTVFLGLDHAWNSDVPVLWETMIFGGEHDQYQERYTSYKDALEGHEKALELLNN